ncbi:hypothetical protein CAOG_010061 [Capsaspora owczarzaki ATCC 30864]|uniref:Uncharacterized protein n=1 Tax=Capsaspora owczarzaki (strain ATCC 30864) TaxID=595528 RepID=A0A0D2WVJ6_CAPO3|nr:hypothetical protein CAOG_010061 [Capsaspora owczarzaki ATCC 30864]
MPLTNLASGLWAGFLATTATHPPDVIRARMQLYPEQYPTFFSSLSKIDEGVAGLARGIVPRVLRKSITTAVTWTIYEEAIAAMLGLR